LRQEVQDPNCSWRRKLELNHADLTTGCTRFSSPRSTT
jgi:hypothetical protein